MPERQLIFEHLTRSLRTYDFLGTDNAVLQRSRDGRFDLGRALAQYAFLPAHIVELLSAARLRLRTWSGVAAELSRNIGEESGSRTQGLSHYEILSTGLLAELQVDVGSANPEPYTRLFLHELESLMAYETALVAAGAVYALEDSAVPELEVVAEIIDRYAERIASPAPIDLSVEVNDELATGIPTLGAFFRMHIYDFEVGHRSRLAAELTVHLPTAAEESLFEQGYRRTLRAMSAWWTDIADGSDRAEQT